ncbi:helix-turn-helix domain-containing protein [Streptomyces sp. NPDC057694]|uniref:helix-turn-helix domain-containing protein n=1 Tax=Streptomyces sp. NPDC057694 TaxID=3346216 RepID=UPI00368FD7C2
MAMIGSRLRCMRVARGLSLRALATAAGVSPTLLSQVERGVTEPSLSTLRKLAEVHSVAMADLFADDESASVAVSRPGEGATVQPPPGIVRYERIAASRGRLEVLRAVLQPGDVTSEERSSRPTVECAYVLAGTLSAEMAEGVRTVRAGEAVTFGYGLAHRYLNETDAPVEFLLMASPSVF